MKKKDVDVSIIEMLKVHGKMSSNELKKKVISESSLEQKHCPECWGINLVWSDEYSKFMCMDCGFVSYSSLTIKELLH